MHIYNKHLKKNNDYQVSLVAILLAIVIPSIASAQSNYTNEPGDLVIVTGTALQNQVAISNRKNSLKILDTLAQDDTGDLADQSLADALARVPGVSTMQVLYAEQESQYVAVRGITPDLNVVTVDGISMISAANQGSGQRRVDLALIPSGAARKTEVYKSFNAENDAGAIGGIINIIPHSAFDSKNGKLFIDAYTNYVDYNDIPASNSGGDFNGSPWSGGIKGLWSKKFGNQDQFGIVLSGVYAQRSYVEAKRNPNGRGYFTATGTSTTPISSTWNGYDAPPLAMTSYDFTNLVRDTGGSVMFEYKPSGGHWYTSLMLYNYQQEEDQTNNIFQMTGFTGITNQTQTTGTLKIPTVNPIYKYDHFRNESLGAIFKSRYDFNENTNLEIRAASVSTSFYDNEQNVYYQAKPTNLYFNYELSGDSVVYSLNTPSLLLDTSSYSLSSAADTLIKAEGDGHEFKMDFTHNFEDDSLGFGYKIGWGIRQFDMSRDQNVINYKTNNSKLGSIGYVPDYISYLYNYPFLWIDYATFRQNVLPLLAINTTSSASSSASADYSYDEHIKYSYLSGIYSTTKTHIIGGIRFDAANYSAKVPYAVNSVYQGDSKNYYGDYFHALPSFNFVHSFTENFKLKASASRTIGRPAPEDIAQAESKSTTNLTISRGNPELKPRVSDNIDIAFEKYFNGRNGLISIGFFSKTIKDDIYDLKTEEIIDGDTYTVTTPMNANESRLKGIEFQYVNNSIGWLPSPIKNKLGMSFNVTHTDGEMDYILSGTTIRHVDRLMYQREWFGNIALFYKLPRKGEVRVAYNYGSDYYDTIAANAWENRGPQGRGQLDMTMRLRLGDDWIIKLQGKNLLDEDLYLGYGENLEYRRAEMKKGRSYFLNIIYKPE